MVRGVAVDGGYGYYSRCFVVDGLRLLRCACKDSGTMIVVDGCSTALVRKGLVSGPPKVGGPVAGTESEGEITRRLRRR